MKNQLKNLAKERIMDALSSAYYYFTDGNSDEYNELSESEQEEVLKLLDKYGHSIGKMLGKKYYTV